MITEGNELRAAGNPNWWKLHETAFLAMGSIADSLVDFEQPDQLPFQLVEFIDSVLMPDLRDSGVDFLQGQGLWFTSRLAKRLPLSVISQ